MDWNNSTVMDRKRIPILQEAISLYNSELYYGCVSILACQLNGISQTYIICKEHMGKSLILKM